MTSARYGLSGHSYVPMRLKEDAPTVEPTPTRIRKRCEHQTTICVTCAPEWDTDYVIFWDRTAGGRELKGKLQERP